MVDGYERTLEEIARCTRDPRADPQIEAKALRKLPIPRASATFRASSIRRRGGVTSPLAASPGPRAFRPDWQPDGNGPRVLKFYPGSRHRSSVSQSQCRMIPHVLVGEARKPVEEFPLSSSASGDLTARKAHSRVLPSHKESRCQRTFASSVLRVREDRRVVAGELRQALEEFRAPNCG